MSADTNQIEPGQGGGLAETLASAIGSASWLIPADAAAVQLAKMLAVQLDEGYGLLGARDFATLSGALNGVLKDLGLSVAGRTGKAEPAKEVTPLDKFREAKASRIADAKALHPSSGLDA